MSDEQGTPPQPPPDDLEVYPVDRLRRRLRRRVGGRPLMVYVVLFAGAATLLLLLGIVWISATNDGDGDGEICTEIAPAEARAAVLDGDVRRIRVLVDQDQPVETLTGVVLELVDDDCRQTPHGADLRDELFGVLGAVELYNEFTDDGVAITYQQQDIPRELLATSTPVPSLTATSEPASPTAAVAPPTPAATTVATATPPPSPARGASPGRTATVPGGTDRSTPRSSATP